MTHPVAFLCVVSLIVITPGTDMALVVRNAIAGRRRALETALGVSAGIAVWSVGSALGIATLLRASASAFLALRLAGALYLLYLGIRVLRRSGHLEPSAVAPKHAFRQGLVTNLLNPKMAVLFTSLIPQFLATHAAWFAPLLLGGVFNLVGLVWLVVLALLASKAARVLERASVRRWIDRLTGVALVVLGIRLAAVRA